MTSSRDDRRLGVCVGRHLIKGKIEVTDIIIYVRESAHSSNWRAEKERAFDNKKACITFAFNARNPEELLFATQTQIFAWNYLDEDKKDRIIQRYLMPLDSANIRYVKFNAKQNCAVVVTDSDAAFI